MTPYSKDGTTEGSDTSSISTIDVTAIESIFTDVDASLVNGEDEDEEFMPGMCGDYTPFFSVLTTKLTSCLCSRRR